MAPKTRQQEAMGRLAEEARAAIAAFERKSGSVAVLATRLDNAILRAETNGVPQEEGFEIAAKILRRTGH